MDVFGEALCQALGTGLDRQRSPRTCANPTHGTMKSLGFVQFFSHDELIVAAREEPRFASDMSHLERDMSRAYLQLSLFFLPLNVHQECSFFSTVLTWLAGACA